MDDVLRLNFLHGVDLGRLLNPLRPVDPRRANVDRVGHQHDVRIGQLGKVVRLQMPLVQQYSRMGAEQTRDTRQPEARRSRFRRWRGECAD
ncbi:hypothetical protein D3C86_1760590 [compost metagenome]